MASPPYILSEPPQFILFGDSITQQSFAQDSASSPSFSFAASLANTYSRRLDVVNRGLSGFNTAQALKVLPYVIPKPEKAGVKFLTIFFGANDSRLPDSPGGRQQTVPLEEFKQNMKRILASNEVKAHKDVRIILITTPPVDERMLADSAMAEPGVINRTAKNAALYAQAVRTVASEQKVAVLDLHKAMISHAGHSGEHGSLPGSIDAPENAKLRSLLSDGLHFTGEGYRVLYEEMMSLIERTWPDQMPERLPMWMPAWDDGEAWEGELKL